MADRRAFARTRVRRHSSAHRAYTCAHLAGLPGALQSALSDGGRDAAALNHCFARVLQALGVAQPRLRDRARVPAVPYAARVATAAALARHAASGGGACGDLPRLWTVPSDVIAPFGLSHARLLPVRSWLVAGVLGASASGLYLEDASGARLQVLVLDALLAIALVDRAVLVTRWSLPPVDAGEPVLEAHSLQSIDRGASPPTPHGEDAGESACGIVLAVSAAVRLATHEFCVVVRSSRTADSASHVQLTPTSATPRCRSCSAAAAAAWLACIFKATRCGCGRCSPAWQPGRAAASCSARCHAASCSQTTPRDDGQCLWLTLKRRSPCTDAPRPPALRPAADATHVSAATQAALPEKCLQRRRTTRASRCSCGLMIRTPVGRACSC